METLGGGQRTFLRGSQASGSSEEGKAGWPAPGNSEGSRVRREETSPAVVSGDPLVSSPRLPPCALRSAPFPATPGPPHPRHDGSTGGAQHVSHGEALHDVVAGAHPAARRRLRDGPKCKTPAGRVVWLLARPGPAGLPFPPQPTDRPSAVCIAGGPRGGVRRADPASEGGVASGRGFRARGTLEKTRR